MSIYSELIERVDDGETFHIDFEKRTMRVGKNYLIQDGEWDNERILGPTMSLDGVLRIIDDLYHSYKYSIPSERSDRKRRKYFKALTIEELTDKQLIIAERREGAQARLEGFILCMILNGSFAWDEDELGKWFYQSKEDADLVILKNWIENKNN